MKCNNNFTNLEQLLTNTATNRTKLYNKNNNNTMKMFAKHTPLISQLINKLKRSETVQHFHLPPHRLINNEKFKMVFFKELLLHEI